jgi:hypothetical protein
MKYNTGDRIQTTKDGSLTPGGLGFTEGVLFPIQGKRNGCYIIEGIEVSPEVIDDISILRWESPKTQLSINTDLKTSKKIPKAVLDKFHEVVASANKDPIICPFDESSAKTVLRREVD